MQFLYRPWRSSPIFSTNLGSVDPCSFVLSMHIRKKALSMMLSIISCGFVSSLKIATGLSYSGMSLFGLSTF